MPGNELVRLRLECCTSMYEQSTDILDQTRFVTVWTRFANDFHTIGARFQVRSSTVCYGLVRLNTTFARLTGHLQSSHTVPPAFVRFRFHTIYIRYWHGSAHSWSELHVRLYIRSRTVSHSLARSRTVAHGLTRSCTIANSIIHGHGTRVSFLKVLKIIHVHGFHGYTRMARVWLG